MSDKKKLAGYYETCPGSARMTSLCPGPLFKSPGLNNYSTPSSRTDTPAQINNRFSRIPFNGIPWPKASPVSKVYDVRNSSTSMILLNNKYSRKKGQSDSRGVKLKGCRLRGQTSNDGDVKGPDPDRHLSETPHVNRRSHMDCTDSSSPMFRPEKKTGLRWANTSQRPPIKFEDGSSVNYKRHTTCMVSDDLRTMNWRRPQRPYSTSIIRESMRSRSPLLEDLNPGERLYMYSIAKVYSVDKMRKQKQSQYCHILHREVERGMYSPEECERYWRYLNSPRKTQQGPDDGYQRRRTKSAPGRRSHDRTTDTAQSGRQSEASRSLRSKSRGSSRPISRASVASSRYYKKKTNDQNGESDIKPEETSNQQTPKKTSNQQSPKKTSNPQTPVRSSDSQTPKKSKPRYQSIEKSEEKDPVKRIPVESDDEEDQNEAQVRGLDRVRDSESSDSDAPTRASGHREGKDRPKSRLGGRKRNAVRKKDTSDDDYSSDSSVSSSDESYTDKTTSQSKSTSDPTSKTSQSNQNKQAQPEKAEESKESKQKEDSKNSPADKDSSYSEDFTETSASQSVSHAKGDKSDSTESKGHNSEAKQSDSSESQTITQSASMSQSKTTSDQTTSRSTKDHTESSISQKADDNSALSSTTESKSDDSTMKSLNDDSSKVKKVDENKEGDKVKDMVKVTDDVKGTDNVKTAVDKKEVKAADESYSDDFTESKSEESKKPTSTTKPEKADKDGRAVADGEKGTGSSTNQRRDSIELESDERVRDWDKIEY